MPERSLAAPQERLWRIDVFKFTFSSCDSRMVEFNETELEIPNIDQPLGWLLIKYWDCCRDYSVVKALAALIGFKFNSHCPHIESSQLLVIIVPREHLHICGHTYAQIKIKSIGMEGIEFVNCKRTHTHIHIHPPHTHTPLCSLLTLLLIFLHMNKILCISKHRFPFARQALY